MKPSLNRRGFLKLASLLPFTTPLLSAANPEFAGPKTSAATPNVIIVVFDAFSAHDASLYGFRRETTPNLLRFAEHATVFHKHYSAGNFTTPGTSSLLTGTYPWTHRAINHYGSLLDIFNNRNIFSEFGNDKYTRIAFTHNYFASIILDHLKDNLDEFILPNEVALIDYNFADNVFTRDYAIASQGETNYFRKPDRYSDSLFLSPILWSIRDKINYLLIDQLEGMFPKGIPGNQDMLYPLEDTIDWIMEQMRRWPQPFLAYLHMMPPHDPYRPRKDFLDLYLDGWQPPSKPDHFFGDFHDRQHILDGYRIEYDQFVTYADSEFGRLHDFLQNGGLFENSIVVLTSDHGEMFERRIWQHTTPTLFQPILRVPLLISTPGQTTRLDVNTTTNSVDVLPTVLHLTKRQIPSWIEGTVLPPYTSEDSPPDRSIYAVEAKSNPKIGPLHKATLAMIKGDYKIIYYRGYQGHDGVFELYNLKQDPEELNDLYDTNSAIASELKFELLAKIEEKDAPFMQTTT
jgi:arylsulfatase A-like enzyme